MYPTEKARKQGFDNFKNEIENYFYYSALINAKRTNHAQKLVNKIAKKKTSLLAKIREIEKIDRNDKEKNSEFYSGEKTRRIKPVTLYNEKYKKKKAKPVKKIKIPGFLSYLFSFKSQLKDFSRATLSIIPRFLGLFYIFSPVYYSTIENINNYIVRYAYSPIKYIIENGWALLEKFEYNVVFTFFRFIKEFTAMSNSIKFKKENAAGMLAYMKNIAPPYMELIKDESNREVLERSIKTVLAGEIKYKHSIHKITELIYHLFDTEITRRNFMLILCSTFTLYHKKLVKPKQIFSYFGTQSIETNTFLCDEEIAMKIAMRIDDILKRLDFIERKLYIVQPVAEGLKISRLQDEQFVAFLKNLISNSKEFKKQKKPVSFFLDYFFSDIIRTLKFTVNAFIENFGDILNGAVEINDETTHYVKIFDNSVFSLDMQKLKNLEKIIDEYSKQDPYIHVTYNHYENYINLGTAESEKDKTGFNIIQDLSDVLFSIGEKLSMFIHNHVKYIQGAERNEVHTAIINSPLVQGEEMLRPIPYHDSQIKNNLMQESIFAQLQKTHYLSINIAYILLNSKAIEILNEKQNLINESGELLEEKSRYL